MVDSRLTVGPYRLSLLDSARGVVVASESEEEALLAQVLDVAADPTDDGFSTALAEGEAVSNVLVVVKPSVRSSDGDLAAVDAIITAVDVSTIVTVPWTDLLLAVDELRRRRIGWQPPQGRQLFRPDPAGPMPSREDIDDLLELEQEAVAIDRADLEAEVGNEPMELVERRRQFLARCDQLAIFDHHRFVSESGGDARNNAMINMGLNVLPEIRDAGLTLREWGLAEPGGSVLEAGVTIDYVRHQLWPPAQSGQDWARSSIAILSDQLEPSDVDQGLLINRAGGATTTVAWRDDGHDRALLGVSVTGTG